MYLREHKYGTNFDMAWLKLDETIPSPYQPMEMLHDLSQLLADEAVTIAGYGRTASNCSFDNQECQGGMMASDPNSPLTRPSGTGTKLPVFWPRPTKSGREFSPAVNAGVRIGANGTRFLLFWGEGDQARLPPSSTSG